jgi:hypothetical protein
MCLEVAGMERRENGFRKGHMAQKTDNPILQDRDLLSHCAIGPGGLPECARG